MPGNSHINGNETADKLSNIGRQLNIPILRKSDKQDLITIINTNIKKIYITYWTTYYKNKSKCINKFK